MSPLPFVVSLASARLCKGNVAKRVKIAPSIDVYGLHIAGTQVTDLNCDDLSGIAGVTVAAGGVFKYDPATKTLTMKDVTVTAGDDKNAIWNEGVEGLKIVVSGTNRLEATNWAALICSVSTEIEGSGSLTATSSGSVGMFVATNLTISDITLAASGERGISGVSGIEGEALVLKNAKVTATGTEAGIADFASFTTEGCKIVTPAGGKFNETKHAVVDAEGNNAKEVKIERTEPVAVTGVTVTPTTVDLKVGETKQLTISIEPARATNTRYTCESDKASVATVDNTGLVTAVGLGTATITVTTEDGNKTATCTVNVLDENGELPLESLSLDKTELLLLVNESKQLQVIYNPSTTTQKGVTWSSDDTQIAAVENGTVKAIAEGQTTITVKSTADPSKTATCKVKVSVNNNVSITDTAFAGVVIAPNPFDNQLRITNDELRGEYALLNAQGVVVRSGNMDGREIVIETSDLTSGLYLLRLTAENGAVKTYRVVKQ